ncbi:hypothetical protein [Nocardia paucivorans]|uniref:hypothetical protein n=1 Tax=Nocardia paucivorans TaxID=114259 RepID=UPI0002D88E98|nr:hypothetical protein [Nocardia paucivorans]
MRERSWISRCALMVAGVCGVAALAACGSGSDTGAESTTAAPGTGVSSSPQTSSAPETSAQVSEQAARNLCDMMRPELSNWRVQGPTIGRVGLNAMVHEWALTNGAINGQVLADKPLVDRVTTEACPDVRQEAIEALDLPDLASGLVF